MRTYTLSAIPFAAALVVKVIVGMISRGMSANAAANAAAAQYDYFRGVQEAQVTQLAVQLGQQTDIPSYEWFNTLRSLQKFGMLTDPTQPTPGIAPPPPPPPPPPKKKESGLIVGIAIVAAVALGFFATRR